jgi:hypothetical protein
VGPDRTGLKEQAIIFNLSLSRFSLEDHSAPSIHIDGGHSDMST